MSTSNAGKWLAMTAVGLAQMAVGLDTTVLNVALPTMSTSLHASIGDLQWFADGYTLMAAAMLLPAGMLGDRLGRKKLLFAALVVFGAGSAWCAWSTSPGELIAARVLLGLGAAFVTPMSTAVFLVLFPDKNERTRAMAVLTSALMVGLPLGPVVGGLLLENFWWGSVFLINLPLCAVGILAVAFLVPESRGGGKARLDYVGVLLSSVGLASVTYAFIESGGKSWGSSAVVGPLLGGIVVLTGLVLWERRVMRRGGDPLVDLRLFRTNGFVWGAIFTVLVAFAMFGLLFFLPLYYQSVQGSGTLGTGLKLLPMIAGVLVGSSISGRVPAQIGPRSIPAAGFALTAAALILGTSTNLHTGYGFTAIWLVIMGAGLGLAMPRTMTAALNTLSLDRSAAGSALLQELRQVGGAVGVALLGAFANSGYRDQLHLPALPQSMIDTIRSSVATGVQEATKIGEPALVDAVRSAFVKSMDTTLWVGGGIALGAAILALLFLPGKAAFATQPPASPSDRSEPARAE